MARNFKRFQEILKNRNFTAYITSYYVGGFANFVQMFAIWAQALRLSGQDPLALGIVTMMEILPGILISPWAGLLADRMSKRTLLFICYTLRAGTLLLMFFSSELWHLYLLAGLHSTFVAFGEPPHRAFLPLLVRPEQYVSMNSLIATMNNIWQIFRPAIGGWVVFTFGSQTAFLVGMGMYLLAPLLLTLVKVHDSAAHRTREERERSSMWQEVREGVAYIRTEPILVYLFVFMMLFTLCMGTQGTLTMLFVGQHLVPEEQASGAVGLLFSALGIGGLVGAFLTTLLVKRLPLLLLLFTSLAFDGVMVVIFAMCDTMTVAITCFAFFGIIGSVNQIVQDTLIQTIVPEHLRGRVYGAFGPITGPLSLLSVGAGTSLASVIGTRAVFMICGVMEIGAVGICRMLPSYKQVRESLAEKIPQSTFQT
ncbi:MFS transporter [Tumebacillus sp. BK434]|uniref:MFS transporter n=1 Tax=Tumebacillus sp. BK434 TaxID=2512169 RepID=UPI00140533E1|nr:MFS transporter [Tumebacillus sp. BK434]